jgi:hypothetical protein
VDERAHQFSETHRRTLGLCLAMMQKLVVQVRELGFNSGLLTEIETDLARIDEEVEAIRPAPAPHHARAWLAELLVLTYEMRPRALKAYGELAEENVRYLEQQSRRLSELVERALDQLEGQSEQEVTARAVSEDPRSDRR